MMDVSDAIIATIGAAGGEIIGRTTIQKLIYFETVSHLADTDYRPHYFGPYSSEVAGSIQELTALGFLLEEIETRETTHYPVSNDWKRYSYKLTRDGQDFLEATKQEFHEQYEQIARLVELCKKGSNLNPQILSWAAKVNFISSQQGKKIIRSNEIRSKAEELKWNLSEGQIGEAIKLLRDLGLVEVI